jgi:hypothetical protein
MVGMLEEIVQQDVGLLRLVGAQAMEVVVMEVPVVGVVAEEVVVVEVVAVEVAELCVEAMDFGEIKSFGYASWTVFSRA